MARPFIESICELVTPKHLQFRVLVTVTASWSCGSGRRAQRRSPRFGILRLVPLCLRSSCQRLLRRITNFGALWQLPLLLLIYLDAQIGGADNGLPVSAWLALGTI